MLPEVLTDGFYLLPQVAINWTICKGALPIPGARNARQAKEAAGAPKHMTPNCARRLPETFPACRVHDARPTWQQVAMPILAPDRESDRFNHPCPL